MLAKIRFTVIQLRGFGRYLKEVLRVNFTTLVKSIYKTILTNLVIDIIQDLLTKQLFLIELLQEC